MSSSMKGARREKQLTLRSHPSRLCHSSEALAGIRRQLSKGTARIARNILGILFGVPRTISARSAGPLTRRRKSWRVVLRPSPGCEVQTRRQILFAADSPFHSFPGGESPQNRRTGGEARDLLIIQHLKRFAGLHNPRFSDTEGFRFGFTSRGMPTHEWNYRPSSLLLHPGVGVASVSLPAPGGHRPGSRSSSQLVLLIAFLLRKAKIAVAVGSLR
jgi:hypothetical protein